MYKNVLKTSHENDVTLCDINGGNDEMKLNYNCYCVALKYGT